VIFSENNQKTFDFFNSLPSFTTWQSYHESAKKRLTTTQTMLE